jgi:hypothetical protein
MKMQSQFRERAKVGGIPATRRQDGMAVIAVVILISIVLIFVVGNARTLDYLRREMRLIETRQTSRLKATVALTNSPALHPAPGATRPPP